MNSPNLMADGEEPKTVRHNPIEQFVLLAKGTRGTACSDLIKNVLEAPGVFVFGDLLVQPNILELEGTPNAKYLNTLNLFAYGTFKEYLQHKDQLIELNDVMAKKLKHLTVVSLAIENKCIPYSDLLEHLHISNVRDLEDLIIEGIYADIIHGKLDQNKKLLEVDYTIGRDIKPEDINKIAATLREWCDSCESVLTTIENQIDRANSAKALRIQHSDEVEKEITKIKKNLKSHSNDMDEDISIDYKESGSSGLANTLIQDARNKKSKPKIAKPTSASSGSGGVKLHR